MYVCMYVCMYDSNTLMDSVHTYVCLGGNIICVYKPRYKILSDPFIH